MISEIIEQSVRNLSKNHNISVNKALVESGVGKDFIANMKKGSSPSIDKIILLANYFQVSTDKIIGRDIEIRNFHQNTIKNRIVTSGIADIIVRYFGNRSIDPKKIKDINKLYAQLSDDENLTTEKANAILKKIEIELEMEPLTLPRMKNIEHDIHDNTITLPIAARDGGILSHSLTKEEIQQAEENTPELPPRKQPPKFDL